MSATITIADLKPVAPAPVVGTSWVIETYGMTHNTVYQAIRSGKLPTVNVPGNKGHFVNPDDVWRIWGKRYVAAKLSDVLGIEA